MTKVLVALDNSLAARPALAIAAALGTVLGAEVEALHVASGGDRTARAEAGAAGLELRTVAGPVVDAIVEAGEADDVVALVLGARATPAGSRPLGSTALAVATSISKPVVVVPPDAPAEPRLDRIMVPVEGEVSERLTPRAIMRLVESAELDVVVLHVLEEGSLPAFTDQPQHEEPAWAHEFLCRYLPTGVGRVQLETRVGRTDELVPAVAEETRVDLVALGWAQELAEGRAPVVRATLARGHLPVLLVPVAVPSAAGVSS